MERNIPAALHAIAGFLGDSEIDDEWVEDHANVILDDSSQSVVITLEELDEETYGRIKQALRTPGT